MELIDPKKLVIAISTHYRHVPLQLTIDNWVKSCPDYQWMYIFVHHPEGFKGIKPPERCSAMYTARVPENVGCMSKTWNTAFQWAFRNPNIEWLLCSMDDIAVRPGWLDHVNKHDFDLYLAPCGDVTFLMHRRVLRRVGWFDERFTVMGFQEWDWEARAIWMLGKDRVMMEDAHGWNINPIGLHHFWHHVGEFCPIARDTTSQSVNLDWLLQKWEIFRTPGNFVDMMAAGGPTSAPFVSEIDWYPWFKR